MSSFLPGVAPSALGGQPTKSQFQQPMGGFSPENIRYANPMQPQVQQPIGGFPGMGQQGLPSGIMQHIQQLQQQMPPMQPQKPVSAARQYLDARKQYLQGGSQGPRPTLAQFRQPQPQPGMSAIGGGQIVGGMPGQQLGGMPPIGQPLQALQQGAQQAAMQAGQGASPMGGAPNLSRMSNGIQQITGAFGAAPQPMTQPPQQGGGMEMGQMFGGMSQQQMLARQQQAGAGGQPPSYGSPTILYGQPPAGGFGATPQPTTQPPAGGFGAAPKPMTQPPAGGFGAVPPPPMRMAMGGSVGMAPPNPYAQQIGQEDPRMQAMRYMQQMNFGG
jgi:hypothetical protein